MSRLLILFSLLILHIFQSKLKAALPAPFPCELKSGVKANELKSDLKQWLLLLDLAPKFEVEVAPLQSSDASFESNYWQSFREVKMLVQNCDQMLAFWQNFGESIETFFGQSEPLSADISQLEKSVFAFEMKKRKKIFLPKGDFAPKAIIQIETFNGVRPWWKVRVNGHGNERIFSIPHYYPESGPLAALISYEILRKWQSEFPHDFWFKDTLLTKERTRILSLKFPWAKSLFSFIENLPPRDILSKYLTYLCLALILGFTLWLVWAIYLDFFAKKQK